MGGLVYGALGIARDDHATRKEFERKNLRFYGAPVAMIFHLPRNAVPGNFLEMGLFLQNVALGLVACGLGSCPQYQEIARDGPVPDTQGPVNRARSSLCARAKATRGAARRSGRRRREPDLRESQKVLNKC